MCWKSPKESQTQTDRQSEREKNMMINYVINVYVFICTQAFSGTQPPPNWKNPIYDLDPSDLSNNGYENEDLMVWMRTAALPNFRKLYRRVNHTGTFQNGLPVGNYILAIGYSERKTLSVSRIS